MPAITRSAARRKGLRSPFEDRTPNNSVKPSKLTTLKRKFAVCREEFDNDEPTTKVRIQILFDIVGYNHILILNLFFF